MKKKILIVDDSPTVAAQFLAELSGEFDCVTACDGEQGFTAAVAERPDAMVVDLEMPMVNGVELLKRLRAEDRTRAVPVVIATTVTAVEQMNECRALGCAGFVLKPVQGDYLRAKLRQLTGAKG